MFAFGGRVKKHEHTLSLIITIGSARVTGSLGSLTKDDSGHECFEVLYATEAPLVYQEQLDVERFVRSMISALLEVAQAVQSCDAAKNNQTIGLIRCVFSAPWFVSQTRIVHLKRKKPFLITDELIHTLAADEVGLFKKAIAHTNSPYTLVAKNNRVIDTHVVQSSINGYPAQEPNGKTGQALSLHLYLSSVSEAILTKISDVLTRSFPIDEHNIDFTTSTLVAYLGVTEHLETGDQYLLIEINGEVTDATIIDKGVPIDSVSFPLGTNTIIRSVHEATKTSPEDIRAKLSLLLKARAERSGEAVSEFERNVFEAVTEWREALYRALEKVAKGRPVPQTALLLLDQSWERLFLTALKGQPFELFTFSDRPFSVLPLFSGSLATKVKSANTGIVYPLGALTGLMHNKLEAR